MSDRKKAFLTVTGHIFCWSLATAQYFIIVGIMSLIEMIISTGANIWLVGLIVLMLIYINYVAKTATKSAIKKMEDEDEL